MISKELLSEVLGIKLFWRDIKIVDNIVHYPHMNGIYNEVKTINIHELAHKCKEWAVSQGFRVISYTDAYKAVKKKGYAQISHKHKQIDKPFQEYTEPEAIFKACQWILEQKAKA